jgi:hypothetical protein
MVAPELLEEVRHFIGHVQADMWEAYRTRFPSIVHDGVSHAFFVTKERVDLLRNLLEYLVFFVERLPLAPECEDAAVVFAHFKRTVGQYCAYLDEKDVQGAVMIESLLRHAEELGPGDIERRRRETLGEIETLLAAAGGPDVRGYAALFLALQRVSEFWFWVKGEQIRHVRESDVYLHRLASLLTGLLPPAGKTDLASG